MCASFCPEYMPKVVLLMSDIKGFTALSSTLNATQLFAAINELFTEFDVLCAQWNISKIESVGDAYLCAAGMDKPEGASYQDAYNLMQMALAVQHKLRTQGLLVLGSTKVEMRISLHCGPVIAGIVGVKNPRYHLFGPNVDAVMALEAAGDPQGVVVSNAFHELFFSEHLKDTGTDEMDQTLRWGLNYAQRGLHVAPSSPTYMHNHCNSWRVFAHDECSRTWMEQVSACSCLCLSRCLGWIETARLAYSMGMRALVLHCPNTRI